MVHIFIAMPLDSEYEFSVKGMYNSFTLTFTVFANFSRCSIVIDPEPDRVVLVPQCRIKSKMLNVKLSLSIATQQGGGLLRSTKFRKIPQNSAKFAFSGI